MAKQWALILGASSGFGAATAKRLAADGLGIAGVHLDRRASMPAVQALVDELKEKGVPVQFMNTNAADGNKRQAAIDGLAQTLGASGARVQVLVHSLAFGTLKPYWDGEGNPRAVMSKANMDMTLDVMAHSLLYWTQELLRRDLFAPKARVLAMTSSGNTRVWTGYGAVSAAKCALEAHVRQLAVELAPHGITANSICAGVTDTPALRMIPGHEHMMTLAREKNPHGRLTTTGDVADVISLLARPEARWITGDVIHVDGGEHIV